LYLQNYSSKGFRESNLLREFGPVYIIFKIKTSPLTNLIKQHELTVLYHMAGWVVKCVLTVNPVKNCATCIQYLSTTEAPEHLKSAAAFTMRLSRGGLTLPTEEIYIIILEAEYFFLKTNPDQFSVQDRQKQLALVMAEQFLKDNAAMEAVNEAPSCHKNFC